MRNSLTEKLKNLLIEAGLNEAEAIVYLELMKSPAQTKWELINKTKLGKNKVYRAFEKLEELGMISGSAAGIKINSFQFLASQIADRSKKLNNLARKLKNLGRYADFENNDVEDFEMIYDHDRYLEKYIMMSELKYDNALDFGDLESFVPAMLHDLTPAFKFRELRAKHAKSHSLCTTDGPFTKCMARKKYLEETKSKIDILNLDFKNKWIIFSDTNDYVMFNDVSEKNSPHSLLIKSKVIANAQRDNLRNFSQLLENR